MLPVFLPIFVFLIIWLLSVFVILPAVGFLLPIPIIGLVDLLNPFSGHFLDLKGFAITAFAGLVIALFLTWAFIALMSSMLKIGKRW